jgi:hypothetical protein
MPSRPPGMSKYRKTWHWIAIRAAPSDEGAALRLGLRVSACREGETQRGGGALGRRYESASEGDAESAEDMEDIGGAVGRRSARAGGAGEAAPAPAAAAPGKQMLSPLLRASLTKQGYKLVGARAALGIYVCGASCRGEKSVWQAGKQLLQSP